MGIKPFPARRLLPLLSYGLLLAAGFFRFWDLGGKSLWVDETKGLKDCAISLRAVFDLCISGHSPPLREIILHYLVQSPREYLEAACRMPSALAGTLTVPMVYALGRFLFGPGAGWCGALLLLLHPWHILHSQDNRMHAVFLLLAVLNLYCVAKLLYDKTAWVRWILWGALVALYAYFTYLAAFPLAALGGAILWRMGRLFWEGRIDSQKRALAKRMLWGSALAAVLFFALYSPWLAVGFRFKDRAKSLLGAAPSLSLAAKAQAAEATSATKENPTASEPERGIAEEDSMEDSPQPVESPFTTHYDGAYAWALLKDLGGSSGIAALFVLGFACLGLASVARHRREMLPLMLLWFLVPLPVMLWTPLGGYFPSRYLIYWLAAYLPLAGHGAFLLIGAARIWLSARTGMRPAIAVALSGAILLGPTLGGQARQLRAYYANEKQDWRSAMAFLTEHREDGAVLITGDHWAYYGIYPYIIRPTRIVQALSLGAFQEAVETWPDAWYIYWAPLPPYIEDIVNKRFEVAAQFPGMLGTITVMRPAGGS